MFKIFVDGNYPICQDEILETKSCVTINLRSNFQSLNILSVKGNCGTSYHNLLNKTNIFFDIVIFICNIDISQYNLKNHDLTKHWQRFVKKVILSRLDKQAFNILGFLFDHN